MASPELIAFDMFYDYQCPYVYRASLLFQAVEASRERNFRVGWRYFSLTQVNSTVEGWTVWGAHATEPVRGRLAFKAAEAARRQGHFDRLHMPLMLARHRDGRDIDQPDVVEQIASEAGLDMSRFREDVADPTIIDALARDHRQAVEEHGVFGTPTLVFADGSAAYVRLVEGAAENGAVQLFDRLVAMVGGEPRIREIKRPSRPVAERRQP